MNQELIASVEELGLSQKEAMVYLACLSLGPAAVQKIADQSGIKRVTTYVILESLVNLGLVSQSTKGKKTLFIAEQPSSLRRLLEKKAEAVRDQTAHFEAILPELQTLQSLQTESPDVRFYDSAEGIRSIMASFLTSHRQEGVDVVYGMSNLDQLHSFFPEFKSGSGNPDRTRAQIRSKFIYTTSQGAIYKTLDSERNRESRYVPGDLYPLNGDLSIVGDNIVMLSLSGSKPIGVTIRSAELAKTMIAIFELSWKAASSYSQE